MQTAVITIIKPVIALSISESDITTLTALYSVFIEAME